MIEDTAGSQNRYRLQDLPRRDDHFFDHFTEDQNDIIQHSTEQSTEDEVQMNDEILISDSDEEVETKSSKTAVKMVIEKRLPRFRPTKF